MTVEAIRADELLMLRAVVSGLFVRVGMTEDFDYIVLFTDRLNLFSEFLRDGLFFVTNRANEFRFLRVLVDLLKAS